MFDPFAPKKKVVINKTRERERELGFRRIPTDYLGRDCFGNELHLDRIIYTDLPKKKSKG